MFGAKLSLLLAAAAVIGTAQSQCYSRVRPYASAAAPAPCAPSDDIATLVQLAKALNDLDASPDKTASSLNVDEIIMKLVNALICTTASTRPGANGGSAAARPAGNPTDGASNGAGNGGLVGGLLTGLLGNPGVGIRLLGPNGEILDLTTANRSVLDVGLGGGLTSTVTKVLSK